jgi:glycosyltransferase involved in cell wall biosynthesis
VRWVSRFVPDDEVAAYFERADLVVLPYREIDQSGVLFTALAFAAPLLVSDVGGFAEVAAQGAAALVAPGDAPALAAALGRLLADPAARARLADGARRAADGSCSWAQVARRHIDLYDALTRRR